MKNKLFHLALISLITLGLSAPIFPGCTEKPVPDTTTTIKPAPDKPTVVAQQDSVPADQYCKTISIEGVSSRATTMRGKLWGIGQDIRVGFHGGTTAKKKYVTDGVTAWGNIVNLNFTYPQSGPYDLIISFVAGSGSWSYVGTDCKSKAQQNQVTTNIGWDGLDVVLHELGHALGMAHEQSSPNSTICWNKEKVYADLGGPPNYWSRSTVDYNVFRKLTQAEAEATTFDPSSIMQYSVPGTWTCDGKGIPGGKTISALDAAFMASKYPKTTPPPKTTKIQIEQWRRDTIVKWLNSATPIQ